MWAFKWIFAALVMLLILGFAVQNTSQTVSLVFVTGRYETGPLPIWLVVYASFALGVVFWLFISIFQVFSLKSAMRRMQHEHDQIKRELDNLRNLSIETEIDAQPELRLAEPKAKAPRKTQAKSQAKLPPPSQLDSEAQA